MARQAATEGNGGGRPLLALIHAARRPEDAPFLAELQALAQRHPGLCFVPIMTRLEPSDPAWSGATGRIDAGLLERIVGSLTAPAYYLAGPPAMVEAMRAMLERAGIQDNVHCEEFYGC